MTANGSQTVGRRKGLYALGVTAAPAAMPGNLIFSQGNIEMDSLSDANPALGVHDLYLQRNQGSDSYFATNSGIPCHQPGCSGQTSDLADISASALQGDPNGIYKVCVDIGALGVPGVEFYEEEA